MINIYENKTELASEEDIEYYFQTAALDELECGQGFYTEEGEAFVQIGETLYLVKFKGEISSSKQDRGDRLYWVEDVIDITYERVDHVELVRLIEDLNKDIDQCLTKAKRASEIKKKFEEIIRRDINGSDYR